MPNDLLRQPERGVQPVPGQLSPQWEKRWGRIINIASTARQVTVRVVPVVYLASARCAVVSVNTARICALAKPNTLVRMTGFGSRRGTSGSDLTEDPPGAWSTAVTGLTARQDLGQFLVVGAGSRR